MVEYIKMTFGGRLMKFLFLAIFIISSTIHLYASYKSDKPLRNKTKPFILLALLGWYICCASNPRCIVIVAIITSWLGDVLLIPKGVKWFTAGGISFGISHLCFVFAYMQHIDFSLVSVWAIVLIALVYFTAVCLVFKGLKPHLPKPLFYPMLVYLMINGTMNSFALFQLISLPCAATVITFIGAVLFFVSDSTLFYVRFKKDSIFKNHFIVMLTYTIAEFMIIQGLIMLA